MISFNQPLQYPVQSFRLPRISGVLVTGIVLTYVVAPLLAILTAPFAFSYNYYGGWRFDEGALLGLVLAVLAGLFGTICLLVAAVRAARTLDYLGERATRD